MNMFSYFNHSTPSHRLWVSVFLGLMVWTGCGGASYDVAPVTGQAMLDGKPLPAACVRFLPQVAGRPASAITDQEGRYELRYTVDSYGAPPGTYRVEITTGGLSADESRHIKELVPAEYNEKTELLVEVKSEPNVIDFDLQSK
ncbi:carboxypeptidase-like regulatory domain-containing protein [Blastopirellula sp. J2-11]|uniref:carboxypeptidase-like regulatory domain-containing protein n=1 Tax=Blastopirellula sp. J2-11 TaxID=2943192 RepID=UPI0021CA24CF|nr:carboxypeptidase-like regulatory domain-containing protein [Blastopirellula sp. J2-11]UUO07368.1 carboxypeptidase-like regulatory domain-containing protein [Blastopirellula sp. J2-11]